jgi:hypothetical protein
MSSNNENNVNLIPEHCDLVWLAESLDPVRLSVQRLWRQTQLVG